ncbi:hypothetical protein HG263_05550 [Pseudoalteromonas sp. JBTF-M23]|uniref:Phage tail fibre protein N-terminal domain-containing protein n=1 Tax=Pseudoalteromonas caenipelagi TaxID=2726988 RepID=A0A849VE74_9GAMM|nr:phage tail protein [Pseudoalteromonas caenipelagi]NOU50001.1 hypothetical protein [Pseudoalteromonas caenipelagi]
MSETTFEVYNFYITEAGESLLLDAQFGGSQVKLTHIAVGTESYDPSTKVNQTALVSEVDRAEVRSFKRVDKTLQMAAIFDNPDKAYNVGEISLVTEEGVHFAVYSRPGKLIGAKTNAGRFMPRFGMAVDLIPSEAINVSLAGDNLNLVLTPELARFTLAQIRSSRVQISILHREVKQIINQN